MAETQQLDPWQSNYLQLKSMSAMLSDIHHKICQLSQGGSRPDEIRPGAHKEAEDLDLKLRSRDRREPMSFNLENLEPNSSSQKHQAPTVAAPSVNPRDRSPMLHFQCHSERSFSFTSGIRDFCEAECVRFGDRQGVEVVEDFNKLLQIDDVESYTVKFEKLRASMLAFNPSLCEAFFVTSYISGLKQEIKNLVKLSRPKSLAAAYEEAIQAIISDLEQEYSDRSDSVENIEDWGADSDRDADFGCQGLRVLGVHPKECNQEARDQSFVISTEFRGKTTSLNLEFHVFEDCSRVAKCQKRSRNYEITGAHILFDEMSKRRFSRNDYSVQLSNVQHQMGNWVFDPGIAKILNYKYYGYFSKLQEHLENFYVVMSEGLSKQTCEQLIFGPISLVEDSTKTTKAGVCNGIQPLIYGQQLSVKMSEKRIVLVGSFVKLKKSIFKLKTLIESTDLFTFDPGGVLAWLATVLALESSGIDDITVAKGVKQRLQWDPGGSCCFFWGILRGNISILEVTEF